MTYILIISAFLSSSRSVTFDLSAYKPDWSTWERVKSSYIVPAWQKISNISPDYAKALGNTALTSLLTQPSKMAFSASEPIYNRYMQRNVTSAQEHSNLDYLTDIGSHTLAAALPALLRLYQEGKIDRKLLLRLLSDPMVLITAGVSAAAGLAATGVEWLNNPTDIDIQTASTDQLEKALAELEAQKTHLEILWNTEKQRAENVWTKWRNIKKSITTQVEAIDKKMQAINERLSRLKPR